VTRVRRINVSQIEGDGANNTSTDEIRPYGELALYVGDNGKLELLMFDGIRTHVKSKVLNKGTFYGGDADSSDGNEFDTIKLVPDEELRRNGSDQYLVIEPTGGEPSHIHIRAGGSIDQSTADLFLGGEINHVKVSDTNSAVNINSSTNAFISIGNPLIENITVHTVDELVPPGNVWRLFINDNTYPALGSNIQIGGAVTTAWGTPITATITDIQQDAGNWQIHVDQDITAGFDDGPQTVLFGALYKTWTFNSSGDLIFPGSSNGRISEDEPGLVVFSDDGFAVLTNANSESSKSWIFGSDGDLTIPGNIGSESAINIDINLTDSTLRRWTFGEDGSFSLPGNLTISPIGNYAPVNGTLMLQAPAELLVFTTSGVGGGMQLGWGENAFEMGNVAIATFNEADSGEVKITTGGLGIELTAYEWTFKTDGNLTFPDNTVQSTAWPGIPGPYADDAAAALAGVAVGNPYYQVSGQVFVRLT
jgi:hypothetical protein